MKTTKPISTVSYNSIAFLERKLNELMKARKVAFWAFVLHKAEEGEKKDHVHVFVEPNGKIDTMDLADFFVEIDPNNAKPLKCVDWRSSKWDDWYLYSRHFEPYLMQKMEVRKYTYDDKSFKTSDEDDFDNRAYRALHSDVMKNMRVHQMMEQGISANKMVALGMVMPAQAFAYSNYQQMYYRGKNELKAEFEPVDMVENPFDD